MHTHPKQKNVSRTALRGMATGLMLASLAPAIQAQSNAGGGPSDSSSAGGSQEKSNDNLGPTVQLDTFEVKGGFAGSLAASLEKKKQEVVITEVISAEDIGKLPDISIAESLSRLPGLTTQRLNGRAQSIVIRGLNADFSTALLNGRQQVSSSSGRSVEFDQYPAELLNSVMVYKSTDASLIGQGLSGTVDLRTARPLSYGRRIVAGSLFYEWTAMDALNADAERGGWRKTLSYVDQFMGGKLGVAIGVSISDRPGQGEQFNAWGYDSSYPNNTSLLGGAKPFIRSSELKRDGYMAVVEYKPNDWLHSTFDIYYSDFLETQKLRGIELPINPKWGTYTTLKPGYTVENGLITQATVENFFGVVRNDFASRDDTLIAGGWNLEVGNDKGWKTTFDFGYSKIERTDFILESYSGYGINGVGTPDTLTYKLSSNGDAGAVFSHLLDYSDGTKMRLGMPQGWGMSSDRPSGQHGFVKGPIAEDELSQYKVIVEHPMNGFFSRFSTGLAFTDREKMETESGPGGMEGYFLQLKNGASSAPMPASIGLSDLSFIGMGKLYSYDPMALYNSGFYDKIANNDPSKRANNWRVKEGVLVGFAKLNIDSKIGSLPITGNIGAQVMRTDQKSYGQAINTGSLAVEDVSDSHDYIDFIPSFNLNGHVTDKDTIRMSISRQLARQPMNDMRAGSTYSFNPSLAGSTDINNSPWSANGGNPELEPWRSNSYDLSIEHYFSDNMGYVALAGFYKDLVSYTYNAKIVKDFTGLPTGVTGVTPGTMLGYNNVPQNGQGGFIRGIEATISLPGEKFTPYLKGFGLVATASFFDSSVKPDLGSPSTPLVGLSDKVQTATVYYERGGFSARVSARYRSDFRGDIATFGPRGAVYRNLQSETVVDAQVSYTFKKGKLKGLSAIVQAYNLTDEPMVATSGDDTRYIQDYQEYGATYSVGVSYKF
ncbi:MAG: TonB-dependent receptor [Opitutaceae bacterium]|nr:TonB-dependent receptor [Opitutaceae bacterium]